MFGREAIAYVVKQATDAAVKSEWVTVNPHIVVEMGAHIAALERALDAAGLVACWDGPDKAQIVCAPGRFEHAKVALALDR